MSPGATRKRPHCTKCGELMAGHPRVMGTPICRSKSPVKRQRDTNASQGYVPPSPPFTPDPSPARHSAIFTPPPRAGSERQQANEFPVVAIPPTGPWHWRNPNWDPSSELPRTPVSRSPSLVSTVLVDDDGNTIRGDDSDEEEEVEDHHHNDRSQTLVPSHDIRRNETKIKVEAESLSVSSADTSSNAPKALGVDIRNATLPGFDCLATVYVVTDEEAPRLRESAVAAGFAVAFIRNPSIHADSSLLKPEEQGEASVKQEPLKLLWGVVAAEAEAAQKFVDAHHRSMPGSIASAGSVLSLEHTLKTELAKPRPRAKPQPGPSVLERLFWMLFGLFRLTFFGAVVGITVVYGLSCL
ncbi:hypothetical protein HGRIS_010066 [Hohenbuehelia grisea]|uniref:Uncharacterized protein n=1 Tax=Hohenbuehelia grisea TaxID=104357 RepID=A0ABR3J339_9AGAR